MLLTSWNGGNIAISGHEWGGVPYFYLCGHQRFTNNVHICTLLTHVDTWYIKPLCDSVKGLKMRGMGNVMIPFFLAMMMWICSFWSYLGWSESETQGPCQGQLVNGHTRKRRSTKRWKLVFFIPMVGVNILVSENWGSQCWNKIG